MNISFFFICSTQRERLYFIGKELVRNTIERCYEKQVLCNLKDIFEQKYLHSLFYKSSMAEAFKFAKTELFTGIFQGFYLQSEQIFYTSQLNPDPSKIAISEMFSISKVFPVVKFNIFDIQSQGDLANNCTSRFLKSIISYLLFKYKIDTKC